ncbi:MAG: hypothetical protein PHY85_07710 [Bacteroidales bacterium]|jgi:hypothetical protein|nr:hypothetical protein [Bacteroidales bacterium]
MMQPILIGMFLILLSSCNTSTQNFESENPNDSISSSNESKLVSNQDTTLFANNKIMDTLINNKTHHDSDKKKEIKANDKKSDLIEIGRYIELPGDRHFNGNPMIQQLDLSKSVLDKFPDTLSKLAVSNYKTYDRFFPIAISDDFENGISTELIIYPKKLIFQFQLFEDEHALRPYITKEIVIRRNEAGEPYSE